MSIYFTTKCKYIKVALMHTMQTRKLSYRKDDHAMRTMYGCPENFLESLSTPIRS